MKQSKFLFGDIVVVNHEEVGVIVKTWQDMDDNYTYEVYNRMTSCIEKHNENMIDRYRIRHKYLDEQEVEWQLG